MTTFWKKRLHSLSGLFFILFLCEHLITNSEAVLPLSERGTGFIRMVNFLQSLPYLPLIEITLLGVPIGIHLFLGILYVYEAKYSSLWKGDGSRPYLPFLKNHLFTWQRITALILAVGVIAHVTMVRFIQKPVEKNHFQEVVVSHDAGLADIAHQLNSTLEERDGKIYVASPDFGTADLFLVRDTFKSFFTCILYTIFVGAASFHAGNGLWTFFIAWGITLNEHGRDSIRLMGSSLSAVLFLLGCAPIWIFYFILR